MVQSEIAFAVILGVLVLVAGVQAYQLFTLGGEVTALNEKIKSGAVQVGAAAASGGHASLPSSLQNLPQMVGGC